MDEYIGAEKRGQPSEMSSADLSVVEPEGMA